MVFVLIMLIVEGGTAIAIFIRCLADQKGIEQELKRRHYLKFPREALAVISVLLVLMTAYSSVALGQLFFFHMLLIRKVLIAQKDQKYYDHPGSFFMFINQVQEAPRWIGVNHIIGKGLWDLTADQKNI